VDGSGESRFWRRIALAIAVLGAAGCASPKTAALADRVSTILDEAVADAIAEGQVPGAVLIVGREAHVLKQRAYGLRRAVPASVAMTVDTIFDLASVSKVSATGMALALLIQEGKATLDDPVSLHLPAWPEKELTLRHLATHTSGFQAYISARTVAETYADLPGDAAVIKAITDHRRKYPRGTGSTYSCLNYLLLARTVEEIARCDLEEYLRERLWDPLGMNDTTYRVQAEQRPRCAPTEAGLCGEVHDPLARLYGRGRHLPGNAGLFSTGPDLARFMAFLTESISRRGKPELRPQLTDLLFANQAPAASGTRRGLGWVMPQDGVFATRQNALTARYHMGFTGTFLWLDLETGHYIVLLTSRLHPDGKGTATPLRKRVAQIVIEEIVRPRQLSVGSTR
jgi:CubicO group peptidase (beta-lactamase class C family)